MEAIALLKTFWGDETYEHMVFPGMVYISHPTEYGTLYTKDELKGLHQVCKAYGIPRVQLSFVMGKCDDLMAGSLDGSGLVAVHMACLCGNHSLIRG